MTTDELDRLEALVMRATSGPWLHAQECDLGGKPRKTFLVLQDRDGCAMVPASSCPEEDAAFIAAAREAVPRLVAEVRRLTRERDEAMQIADKWAARAEQLVGVLEAVAARVAK